MDDSHLAPGSQTGSKQSSDDINMAFDFDTLMSSGSQLPNGFEAMAHYNHDDLCLDPQGVIQCAHAFRAPNTSSTNSSLARLPEQNSSLATGLRSNQPQAHSRDRHSISNPPQLSAANQAPSYPWDNFFNESILDTFQFFNSNELSTEMRNVNRHGDGQVGHAREDDCVSTISCTSACATRCPSQCGETGQGVCCDDDACAEPELCLDETCTDSYQPCTDANCPSVFDLGHSSVVSQAISDPDKQAAAALASFGGENQLPLMQTHFSQFHPHSHLQSPSTAPSASRDGEPTYRGFPETSLSGAFEATNAHHDAPSQFEHINTDLLATHLFQYHNPSSNQVHVRPCIADNPGFFGSKCNLPKTADHDNLEHRLDNHACGFQVHSVDQFASHLFADHRLLPISRGKQFVSRQPPQAVENIICDAYSLLPPGLPATTYQLDANQEYLQHFSPSNSNMSVDSPMSPTSTSLATTPPLKLERCPTEPISITTAQSTTATPGRESQLREDDLTCCWRTGHATAICGMKFENANELHAHGKAEHLKKLKRDYDGFHCTWGDCGRVTPFNQKSKLERHLQTHTGYKPVKCDICGMQLSAKQSLDQHLRTHTGETPWKCMIEGCSHAFKQQSALTMHMRTHTKEKPLVCDVCGKSFGESSNLSKHRRTHNAKGNHVCAICHKDFHRLDQLRRHMQSKHSYKPDEAEKCLKRVRGTAAKVSRKNNS